MASADTGAGTPTVDVSIAAHYVPRRVPFLVAALDAIAEWRRHRARVRIVTNDLAIADEPRLAKAVERLREGGVEIEFERAHGMAHPWHLTWCHKDYLREWSRAAGHAGDLFMYLEDDMAMTEANLDYFQRYLPAAKAAGCIPSFVVYEIAPDGTLIAQGFRGSHLVTDRDIIKLGGQDFVAPEWPYWPGFIMDRDLAREYFASPYSNMETMPEIHSISNNDTRAQSAFALAYHNPPSTMKTRYVVAIDENLQCLPEARALHAAGNYSVSKDHSFGTVPLAKAFRTKSIRALVSNRVWQVKAIGRRIADKARREMQRPRGQSGR